MANLYIAEYPAIAGGLHGGWQLAPEPAHAEQKVTFTTATASSAFGNATNIVRLLADADCHVEFGADPTATASNQKLIANVEYWRAVQPGHKVSVYDGSS